MSAIVQEKRIIWKILYLSIWCQISQEKLVLFLWGFISITLIHPSLWFEELPILDGAGNGSIDILDKEQDWDYISHRKTEPALFWTARQRLSAKRNSRRKFDCLSLIVMSLRAFKSNGIDRVDFERTFVKKRRNCSVDQSLNRRKRLQLLRITTTGKNDCK